MDENENPLGSRETWWGKEEDGMKKYSFLAALFLGLLLMAGFPVYAAGGNSLALPLSLTWGKGGLQEDRTYQLVLKGQEESCPMPTGSGAEYSLILRQDSAAERLPEIRYEKPGDYWYTLTLTREDGRQIGLYALHVMALNGEDGSITVVSTLREKDPRGAKTDRLQFVDDEKNGSEKEAETKPEKGSGGKKPSGTNARVQTGDENDAVFWLFLLLAAMAGIGRAARQLLLDIKRK